MRSRMLAVLATGLTMAGCAGNSQMQGDGTPEAAESSTVRNRPTAQSDSPPVDGSTGGAMIPAYGDAQSSEAMNGRTLLQGDQLLEELADNINRTLNLPYDIWLRGSQCDEANAMWNGSANTVTICYEGVTLDQRIFTEAGDPDPRRSALNSEYAKFYHEVAHMAISLYRLPITGPEEDAADQLAAYILLTPGDDGHVDPESVQAMKDLARTLGATESRPGQLGEEDSTDVHSLDQVRMYNLQCWIYGSNPEANADLVTDGQLPEGRASGCRKEWEQIEQAWSALLEPHFK
ncbi:DUF4344 domain-containing metallopeptidase [Mycolicibacterium sp. jd]|uniref:DUF4344 domain-containing metallopeptidase n=1 Tax=unclassified Mycolicibacterium TaxID=2636767 RepID=UPI00351BAE34